MERMEIGGYRELDLRTGLEYYAGEKDTARLPAGLLERAEGQVPMVYPLLIEREELRHVLKANHIFVGQWWKYLLEEPGPSAFEKRLSRYLLPIQIDQRYGPRELDDTAGVIAEALGAGGSVETKGV